MSAAVMVGTYANNRMSSLPFTQFCAKAGQLSGGYGSTSGRLSSAFHWRTGKTPGWEAKVAMLTDKEEAEINTWSIPREVDFENGTVLRYENAEIEVELGLTADLSYCNINAPEAVTRGHMDHGWVVKFPNGQIWVFVVDIKRSEWTVKDGPESLQLQAYGFAFAAKHNADVYVPAIWAATEGDYWWGSPVNVGSAEGLRLGQRVLASAQNLPTTDNQYTLGSHCTGCYGRMRCPAYLLPPEMALTELAPFTEERIEKGLTTQEGEHLLLTTKRAEETAKAVRDQVKERIRRGLSVLDERQRLAYRPVMCKGKPFDYYDHEAAKADGVDLEALLEKYKKVGRGKPYDQFKWVKP